jgi:hypothetical protein
LALKKEFGKEIASEARGSQRKIDTISQEIEATS